MLPWQSRHEMDIQHSEGQIMIIVLREQLEASWYCKQTRKSSLS